MSITLEIPAVEALPLVARHLSVWQFDPWTGQIHPGDLGWRTLAGAAATASQLRVWKRGDCPVAIGMFDDGVLRMGIDPAVIDDEHVAAQIANDVDDSGAGLFDTGKAVIEARGARALRNRLQVNGWTEDEPWTSLTRDLSGDADLHRDKRANLRVERVGLDVADRWTSVHWSAFRGTAFEGQQRDLFIRRWLTMVTGPLADRAHNLIGYDSHGSAVAVATVWTAGNGRPGLVEPLGVHREHHGGGYGAAMALAAAHELKRVGASSANVAAECSNPAAIATYLSAGFVSLGTVADLRRN